MKNTNWLIARPIYFLISAIFIAVGVFSIVKWGLPLGVEFKGGSLIEYKFEKNISQSALTQEFKKANIETQSIQNSGENSFLVRASEISADKKIQIKENLEKSTTGKVEELRFESIGPSIGKELIKKTVVAIVLASLFILIWIAYQFKSLKFGVSAILATLHDTFILIGLFALLGHTQGAVIDFLFVTALLTTLSFSVHDTIVVYDRIREIRRRNGGDISSIANRAISETMRRSINNSLTIIFMLLALAILGGLTIRWFAVALLIGTISGTYSSPFVAVPLIVTWEGLFKKFKKYPQ